MFKIIKIIFVVVLISFGFQIYNSYKINPNVDYKKEGQIFISKIVHIKDSTISFISSFQEKSSDNNTTSTKN